MVLRAFLSFVTDEPSQPSPELIDCLKRGRLKVSSLGLLSFSDLLILVSPVFCYYAKGEAHY